MGFWGETDCFDSCDTAMSNFDHSADIFSDTFADWADGGSSTFGDVMDTGIDAAADWVQMDTACDSGGSDNSGD